VVNCVFYFHLFSLSASSCKQEYRFNLNCLYYDIRTQTAMSIASVIVLSISLSPSHQAETVAPDTHSNSNKMWPTA
jgi:hypothetical protein